MTIQTMKALVLLIVIASPILLGKRDDREEGTESWD